MAEIVVAAREKTERLSIAHDAFLILLVHVLVHDGYVLESLLLDIKLLLEVDTVEFSHKILHHAYHLWASLYIYHYLLDIRYEYFITRRDMVVLSELIPTSPLVGSSWVIIVIIVSVLTSPPIGSCTSSCTKNSFSSTPIQW